MSAETLAEAWDLRGGSLWLDREQWGVVIDALIQHRGHADQRKAVNSESTSDVRSDMCADLIRLILDRAERTAERDEARAALWVLSGAATRGPWRWDGRNAVRPAGGPLRSDTLALTYPSDAASSGQHRANAAFIAAAVNYVRAALSPARQQDGDAR